MSPQKLASLTLLVLVACGETRTAPLGAGDLASAGDTESADVLDGGELDAVDGGLPDGLAPTDGPAPDGFVLPDSGLSDGALPDLGLPDGFVLPDLGIPDASLPDGFGFPDFGGVFDAGGFDLGPLDSGGIADGGLDAGDARADAAACDCTALDGPCQRGVCDPSGACRAVSLPNGTSCTDGSFCTSGDVCVAGQCTGQPITAPGDNCASPIPLPGTVGLHITGGDTACAMDDTAGSCAAPNLGDVMFSFTVSDGPRRVILETLAAGVPVDTALSLRSFCGAQRSELICDDDGGIAPMSRIERQLDPGTYYALVDAPGGSFHLSTDIDPQDTCRRPSVLAFPAVGQAVEVTGTTVGASNSFEATCAGNAGSPDHVYRLEVTAQADLRFETLPIGGQYDTALHIHAGACTQGSAARDHCDDDGAGSLLSLIEGSFAPGVYFVVVDGFGAGSAGTYRLRLSRSMAPTTEWLPFPTANDARLQQNPGLFTSDGDFVEGVRRPMTVSPRQLSINAAIVPGTLLCGQVVFGVLVNGRRVGGFAVSPGDLNVTQTMNLPGRIGGTLSIRYEVDQDIDPMCGGVELSNTSSFVGFTP